MTEMKRGVSRRTLLKSSAALAGLAGMKAITGFPAVHAAEPITLRYLSTSTNQSPAIAEQAFKDTGVKIEYVSVTTDDVTKRIVTQPDSFDLVDTEYFSLRNLVPSGNLMGMDAKKIKLVDKLATVITKGEIDGKKIGDQGTAPHKVTYLEGQHSKKFATEPTEWLTLIPTTYNADTLGIRPDLIKRPITSWAELLNPELGQGRHPQHPVHRHHGRRHGQRGAGQGEVRRQGQHDQGGDRHHDRHPDRR